MRIALVYEFLTECGGIERLIANNARMLEEEGFEVDILTCHYDKDILEKTGLDKFNIINISKLKTKTELISLISSFLGFNKIKQLNYDLFISYSFPSNYLIRKTRPNKNICFVNHYPRWLYSSIKERLEWAKSTKGLKRMVIFLLSLLAKNRLKKLDMDLLNRFKLIFTSCDFLKRRIDKTYGFNSVICPPPIDPVFKESKEKLKEKFIFCSGRIIPDKKFDWLIESASHMKNKIPFYFSGEGDHGYIESLKNLAREKNVEVRFLGRVSTEELVRYYSSAQEVVFPLPMCEYGMVVIEGLSCGTPAVVWGDGAGPAEQVIDGVNGRYAEPYNLKDFARKMDFLLDKDFKKNKKKEIVESAKRYSYDGSKKIFISNIKRLLNSN